MLYWLYSLTYTLGFLLALPYFLVQGLAGRKYFSSLKQRLGWLPNDLRALRASSKGSIWVHAVSVGEVLSVLPLSGALRKKWPDRPLYLSTATTTGYHLARSRLAGAKVLYFPFDWKFSVRRTFNTVQPDIVLIAETEIWPTFLRESRLRGVPVMLINGRISDRSVGRYRKIRWFLRRVLPDFSYCGMQTLADRDRLLSLGAPPEITEISGNLKYDLSPPAQIEQRVGEYRQLFGLNESSFLVIAGSTMKDEEGKVLSAFEELERRCPKARLLLAPRHPERFKEVEQLLKQRGASFVKRSELKLDGCSGAPTLCEATVLLLDSIGELASLYVLADVVFIGGSLAATGGHNILEPALFGKPILFGPHMTNFRDIAALFLERQGALLVADERSLAQKLVEFYQDPALRRKVGESAYQILRETRGATEQILTRAETLLRRKPLRLPIDGFPGPAELADRPLPSAGASSQGRLGT